MDASEFNRQVYGQDVQYGEEEPHCWIQWKGTDVCMDVHCACGAHLHFDGEFCYFLECPHCGIAYAVGENVKLIPLNGAQTAFVLEERADLVKAPEPDSEMEVPHA